MKAYRWLTRIYHFSFIIGSVGESLKSNTKCSAADQTPVFCGMMWLLIQSLTQFTSFCSTFFPSPFYQSWKILSCQFHFHWFYFKILPNLHLHAISYLTSCVLLDTDWPLFEILLSTKDATVFQTQIFVSSCVKQCWEFTALLIVSSLRVPFTLAH